MSTDKQKLLPESNHRFSPRAPLAALGLKLQQLDFFKPIRETVKIEQKTVHHSPFDKLLDALITILAGAGGLCEITLRLRPDQALQRAFGREDCAESRAATTRPICRP
jgi:hypothetical protein